MDNPIAATSTEAKAGAGPPCTRHFWLCDLEVGKPDKLGHEVEEIFCIFENFAVYRSQKGVHVHFSNCKKEEQAQRDRFAEICPELCELRYLTDQMRSGWILRRSKTAGLPSSLYDHNIAQAIMLVMQKQVDPGKLIARQALQMAVRRVTNDNTIRYMTWCACAWFASIVLGCLLLLLIDWKVSPSHAAELRQYVLAGMSGATGALLSVATRLQAFRLKPCDQSNMKLLMGCVRICIGVVAGTVLLLLAPTIFSETLAKLLPHGKRMIEEGAIHWQTAAALGLVGGFFERLVPNLLRPFDQFEPLGGTPVQAVGARRDLQAAPSRSPEHSQNRMDAHASSPVARNSPAPHLSPLSEVA